MKLFSIFSAKPASEFIEAVEKYLNSVERSLVIFKDTVRAYLYNDREEFDSGLSAMAVLETEADALRREIESRLYSKGAMVRQRGDVMRLLERFDHILSIVSNDLIQFEIETPRVPQELKKEFLKLSELASMAVETSLPGVRAYFTEPKQVSEASHQVFFYDKEAVRLSQSIKRNVFHSMNSLKLSEKFHLRYFALHIEDLSTAAAKVAEQLSVMAIKRSL